MLILLSPAKNMNFDAPERELPVTVPALLDETRTLSATTRGLSTSKIKSLMKISADLARLNRERFQAFDADQPGTKQAALAFAGEVYRGLEAGTLDDDDLAYAQDHLRILSGMYGALRPLDGIHPYRLEMGRKLHTRRGESLYDFWGDKIAQHLNELQAGDSDPVVLNLASNEYFKAVDQKALKARVITASFKEEKDGQARMLMVFAKKARGMMARWAIENRISDPADLVKFDAGGYTYDEVGSSESDLLFTRPQPAAAGAKAKAEA
ncbi:peroxide stress protein YaaA [uncultured Maricaulis sp.]|uniref:peroxide stress protein YaaA n=1 Tax=uncultured Maricaulis sp. TaxID=174710 RepID=UPI0030D97DB9|tara:strand:- start:35017 stop:35817 length:801 start_codon:yes stop_codon:yes gene_type:complete